MNDASKVICCVLALSLWLAPCAPAQDGLVAPLYPGAVPAQEEQAQVYSQVFFSRDPIEKVRKIA